MAWTACSQTGQRAAHRALSAFHERASVVDIDDIRDLRLPSLSKLLRLCIEGTLLVATFLKEVARVTELASSPVLVAETIGLGGLIELCTRAALHAGRCRMLGLTCRDCGKSETIDIRVRIHSPRVA